MRLVFPPDHPGQEPPLPASSLLKALARGRQWYEWIVAGEVSGRRTIAQKLGLNERYVGRVLECAFLAPDIVEAILDGHQPQDLTFKKLTHRVPLSWTEQHRQLGFQPSQSR
jgi:site-specific DNA recombinase